jgi:hypothetical protein
MSSCLYYLHVSASVKLNGYQLTLASSGQCQRPRWPSGAYHWTQGSRVHTRPRTMDFKGDKIRSTPSLGGEVDLRHVKEPYEHDRCSSAKFSHVSHPHFTCFAARWQTNQD